MSRKLYYSDAGIITELLPDGSVVELDPFSLRAKPATSAQRLAEAHALLVRCQRGLDHEQDELGRDLDAWLKAQR